MKTKNKRLMWIKYVCKEDTIQALKTILDKYDIKYVVFKEYDIGNEYSLYHIYIDKNRCTWGQVMEQINSIQSTKFNYVSGEYIKDGKLYY